MLWGPWWDALPDDARTVLLDSAFVPVLEPALVDAVVRAVPDAASWLARLERDRGPLRVVPSSHGPVAYRRHPLLTTMVQVYAAGRPDEAKPLVAEALQIAHLIDDRVSQFHLLGASACLAAGSGHARSAVQLLGAAATVGAGAGAHLMPFLAPLVEQAEASALVALGRPRFDAAFLAGSRLDRDAAVRLALGGPAEVAASAPDRPDAGLLSKREAEVARLVADGLTNKEIGARLFISEHTVDSHVRGILNKLGFDSRARVAAWMAATRE
jgi:DNA-binding CsgD family transcriptional regulator